MLKDILESVLKSLIKAIFISSFLVAVTYFLFGDMLSQGVFLLNRMIVVENKDDYKNIEFNTENKRLINYPSYGQVWSTIKIPKIGVEALVYHGDSLDLLKKGIGHFASSYFSGEGGTVILAGHNSDAHFKKIVNLRNGDKVIIEAEYGTFTYEVRDSKIVDSSEIEKFNIQSDKEELIIYTCYPTDTIGYKSERYVVYLNLVGESYES